MSLILDALKKSEAERRLGQAPGLSSAFAQAPRRERGPLLWSLLLLIVVSSAALWHNRELFGDAAESDEAPAGPATGLTGDADQPLGDPRVASAEPAQAAVRSTRKPTADRRGAPSQPGAASLPMPRPQTLAAPVDVEDPLAGVSAEHRELIEQGQLVVPNPQILAQRGATREPQIVTAEAALPPTIEAPAAVEAEDGSLVFPLADAAVAEPGTPAPAAASSPVIATVTGGAAAATSNEPTPQPTASAVAASNHGVPLIYDLSLGQRQGLPELKISMHVYHRDVARRFAIIDGRRLNEGDPIGQLLWAREIVPEGVIIEYRDLRFLLPRPGG